MIGDRRKSQQAKGAVAIVVVMAAGLIGCARHTPESDVHAQDVILCTSYDLIEASLQHPIETGADALPAIAPLRLALLENPDGSTQIRDAISAAIAAFDAILAKDAKPRGLSEPPPYDRATVDSALRHVRQVCGLDT
ncbi:MAG TPA: hypothetical protein VFR17_13425 [Mycobacterium sp.]|nr:hypothetical protein [Mycobacterium sp.]